MCLIQTINKVKILYNLHLAKLFKFKDIIILNLFSNRSQLEGRLIRINKIKLIEFKDSYRILVSYGNESEEQIAEQLKELDSQLIRE